MKYTQFTIAGSLLAATLASGTAQSSEPLTVWEKEVPGEEEDALKVAEELIAQIKTDTVNKGMRAFRDAHPRGIGCVAAKFTVDPSLPLKYQTGIFATPGKEYDSLIRFSSSLGPVGDNVKDARGMAIKVFGVPGKKLLADQADATTQDFIQINATTFPARDAKEFAGIVSIKTNPINAVKFLLERPILRAREIKALLGLSSGNPDNGKSLADHQFFSQVSYLLKGPQINSPIKFTTRPCGPTEEMSLDGSESELRNDLQARLAKGNLCYEFAMQFYAEGQGLTVEDGMNEWKEAFVPFVKFATVIIPKQTFLTDEKLHYCDALSMHPWHALPEHRPLGNLNRTRKIVYNIISDFRHTQNNESSLRKEPVDLTEWNSFKSTAYKEWDAVTIPVAE